MALKFYLPSSGAPAVSPAYATYDDSTQADRIGAVATRGSSALASKAVTEAESGATTTVLVRQYTTPPLNAFNFVTPTDTFDFVLRAMEDNLTDNARLYLVIRVVSGDGATFRGTLYTSAPSTNEFIEDVLTAYGRTARAVGASVAMQAGDRLVIEYVVIFTAPGASAQATLNFGEDGAAELTVGFTDTDADWPYILFNSDLSLYGGAAYSLTCDGGSYGVTGTAVGTLKGSLVGADPGSYALSGQVADALFGRKVAADSGDYALSGQDVSTLFGRKLPAEVGGYALTGQDATLLRAARIGADGGTYILSGLSADLLFDRLISLDAGSYVLMGQDADLIYISGYTLAAEAGSYTLAGQAANLLKANKLPLEAGAYVLTGQGAGVLLGRRLAAETGSHVIVGQAANLLRDGRIVAEPGSLILTGADSGLVYSGIVAPLVAEKIYDAKFEMANFSFGSPGVVEDGEGKLQHVVVPFKDQVLVEYWMEGDMYIPIFEKYAGEDVRVGFQLLGPVLPKGVTITGATCAVSPVGLTLDGAVIIDGDKVKQMIKGGAIIGTLYELTFKITLSTTEVRIRKIVVEMMD